MDVFDSQGRKILEGNLVSYKVGEQVRFATVNDVTGNGRLYVEENLYDLNPEEVTVQLIDPVARLEEDMRRYLYDRDPARRISCLTAFQERMAYRPWAEREEEKAAARRKELGFD